MLQLETGGTSFLRQLILEWKLSLDIFLAIPAQESRNVKLLEAHKELKHRQSTFNKLTHLNFMVEEIADEIWK